MSARTPARGYVVAIRRNGSTCGCTGPYTSRAVASAEANALRSTLGDVDAVVLGVRDNGFREAWGKLSGAYREAGRATAEAGREAVTEVRAAPGRAVAAAKKKASSVAAEARRRAEEAADKQREKAALALAEQIEGLGYDVVLRKKRKNGAADLARMVAAAETGGMSEAALAAGTAARHAGRAATRAAGDAGSALAELVTAATRHRKNSRKPRTRKAR
jgi:hypothetical protein